MKLKPSGTAKELEKSQMLSAMDVENGKQKLGQNAYFKKALGCNGNLGNFNFKASVDTIFKADSACVGIRYFFGYEEFNKEEQDPPKQNKIRVILVGVDKDGKSRKVYRENSLPNSKKKKD